MTNGVLASLACSFDGKLISACDGSSSSMWNVTTGKQLWAIRAQVCFGFCTGEKTVAAAQRVTRESCDVLLVDASTGKELRRFPSHQEWLTCLAVNGDGRLMATAGKDMTLRIWEVQTGKELHCIRGIPTQSIALVLQKTGCFRGARMAQLHVGTR